MVPSKLASLRQPRMARYPLSLSNVSEHYVGAWAPQVGGRALAEGEILCLRCSMPRRVSISFDVRFATRSTHSSFESLRIYSDQG